MTQLSDIVLILPIGFSNPSNYVNISKTLPSVDCGNRRISVVTVGFPLLALNAICRRSLVIHHILPVINNTKLKSLSIETKNPGNCQPVASFSQQSIVNFTLF